MSLTADQTIRDTIERKGLIRENGHVVVGLSGGPDSMCLFHVLYNMRDELGITLSAVHLNHKFRPGHAEDDQKFVENLSGSYGVHCYSKTVDVNEAAAERGETPEEAGRTERYIAFDEEACRVESSGVERRKIVIAVAQNRNDRIETVIMRILRGTGPDGLSGIPYNRKSEAGFDVVRPLLDTDRRAVEKYCLVNELNPRIDHTNAETDYSRNRIRLDLLPKLKKEYNSNVEEALFRLSHQAHLDKDYFSGVAESFVWENCERTTDDEGKITAVITDSRLLGSLHPSLGGRVIISILGKLGLTQGIEAGHIAGAMKVLTGNETGKVTEFPSGYRMKISYGSAKFYNEYEVDSLKESIELNFVINPKDLGIKKEVVLPYGTLSLEVSDEPVKSGSKLLVCFDYDTIKNTGAVLKLRRRRDGDRISLKGMRGTKKLQDLFVDEKIPRNVRDEIPLVVLGQDILWVVGIRSSAKYSKIDDAKEFLLLEWKPKN